MITRITHSQIAEFLRAGWVFQHAADEVTVGWGECHWSRQPESGRAALFAPDFYLNELHPWFTSEHAAVLSWSEWLNLQTSFPPAEPHLWAWREPELQEFAFALAQERIAAGELRKAVPVVRARAAGGWTAADRAGQLRRLSAAVGAGAGRLYGAWAMDDGFLGVTPERLFRVEGDCLQSMALAGTRAQPLSAAECEEFLRDRKERAEHAWVVEDLGSRLAQLGDVQVSATFVRHLPGLAHLQTDLFCQMRAHLGLPELAKVLHPSPALGVFPRAHQLHQLRWLDPSGSRRRFGAPIGLASGDESVMECWVAIRCSQWQAGEFQIFSGCGVVAESVLANEWEELAHKRQAVRQMLGVE